MSPRHDVVVSSPAGEPLRHTVYSGQLCIGPPAPATGHLLDRGRDTNFAGGLFLPDSHRYGVSLLDRAVISAEVWIASKTPALYVLVDGVNATFEPDERDPSVAWVQLSLRYLASIGNVLGYRVTATVGAQAVTD